MAKPTNLAEWATGGGAPITEPLLAEKQAGWPVGYKPPAQWFNWWMKAVYLWIVWLNEYEITAHTWTALQTYSAGILSAAFGSTSGIRGTSAINNVPGMLGSHTTGVGAGVKGTSSSNTGFGGHFVNTGSGGGAIGVQGEGRYGGNFIGSEWFGVVGSISAGATNPTAAGVLGSSTVLDRPGVRGEGNESSGAWGGEFIGADSGESSTPGGLGLWFRGGNSSITDFDIDAGNGMVGAAGDATGDGSLGQAGSGGTNTLRGGNVDGTLNDEGLPGIGLTLTGGSVTDDANGRTGATALKLVKGTATVDGLALEADGDCEIDGRVRLLGGNEAINAAQTKQISPGLMCKAWVRIAFTGGVLSAISGQNVTGVGIQDAAQGRFYVDLAIAVDKTTRCAVGMGDVGRSLTGLEEASGDALGRSDTRAIFRIASESTGPDTPINLTSGAGAAYVLIFGL